jgi:hypothetical protein
LLHKSEKATDDPTVYLWWIPLTYTTDYKTIGSNWLADSQPSKNLTLESEIGMNDWIIFNVDETGKFRFLVAGSKKLLIYNVNRLLSGQLRRAQLEVDWPTTDDESHGHFSY